MAEENAGPIVDQHNNFKASCTHNEKEHGVSDSQPTRTQVRNVSFFLMIQLMVEMCLLQLAGRTWTVFQSIQSMELF